ERFAQYPGPAGRFTDPDGVIQQANTLWAWHANSGTSPPTFYKTPVPQNAALFAYHNQKTGQGYGEAAFGLPQVGIWPAEADYRLAQSAHRGTIRVGLGDGTVRGPLPTISLTVWQEALVPDDGVKISSDW